MPKLSSLLLIFVDNSIVSCVVVELSLFVPKFDSVTVLISPILFPDFYFVSSEIFGKPTLADFRFCNRGDAVRLAKYPVCTPFVKASALFVHEVRLHAALAISVVEIVCCEGMFILFFVLIRCKSTDEVYFMQ